MKRLLVIGIILLFLFCNISFTTLSGESRDNLSGKTLYVGGSGEGNYTKIQGAIDNASDGDTVFVYSGVYAENININKSIRLIGEKRSSTKIDGEYKENTVNIIEDGVIVSGFTIESGYPWGIEVKSNDNIISNNYISCSIWLYAMHINGGSNNTISSNIMKWNSAGLVIEKSVNNIITNNTILETDFNVRLIDSSGNIVTNNTIGWGVNGIYLGRGLSNIIMNNDVSRDIHIVSSSYTIVRNNTVSYINLENSVNTTFHDNEGRIYIYGEKLEEWNSHIIERNYYNEQPIYYYKNNPKGEVIPANTGQIILANCQNFSIQNLSIINGGNIQLAYCHYCEITGNYLNNSAEYYKTHGIFILGSSLINITNNTIKGNYYGIYFLESQKNTVKNNNLNYNIYDGFYLDRHSSNNIIIGNIVSNNNNGISLYYADINRISENIISINSCGINLLRSNNNSILCNYVFNNGYGIKTEACYENYFHINSINSNDYGVYLEETTDLLFSSNNFIDNDKDVYFRYSDNIWEGNYWDYIRGNTKILFGTKQIGIIIFIRIIIPWMDIDWSPAKEPYDIQVPEV